MSKETINAAIEAAQTPGGLIALLMILSAVLVFLLIVVFFNLEITFKPFSIKRVKKINDTSSTQIDIDFLIKTIKNAYDLFETRAKVIHKDYKNRLKNSSDNCINLLVNKILMDYSDMLYKQSHSYDNEQRDILTLYLEKDVNEVILDTLQGIYDVNDLTQSEAENLVESSIKNITFLLRSRLVKYHLLKDRQNLNTIYDELPKTVAGALREALKQYLDFTKEEREKTDELMEEHNKELSSQIRRYLNKGRNPQEGDNDKNGTIK